MNTNILYKGTNNKILITFLYSACVDNIYSDIYLRSSTLLLEQQSTFKLYSTKASLGIQGHTRNTQAILNFETPFGSYQDISKVLLQKLVRYI